MIVVAGPGPSLRKRSRFLRFALPFSAGALCYIFHAIGNSWVANLSATSASGSSSWPQWSAGILVFVGLVSCVLLQTRKVKRDLAEFRRCFPEQSLDNRRWVSLPFVRWTTLFYQCCWIAAAVGLAAGLLSFALGLQVGPLPR